MESTSCSSGCAPSPWTAERGRSFTSPGFSLCLLSILYTVLCDISIVWEMCDTVAPAAFIPMTCHRWLMVLFPMTKSNWTVTKSWLLGWPKLCWFQLYCSKTIWSISLIFARHITSYIHIILTIFQEAAQCLTLLKISLKMFCKNFFPGVYNHNNIAIRSHIMIYDSVYNLIFATKFSSIYLAKRTKTFGFSTFIC